MMAIQGSSERLARAGQPEDSWPRATDPLKSWAKEIKAEGVDQPDEIAADVTAMGRLGVVGFRYHEESHHGNRGNAGIVFKGRSDVDLAVEVLHKSAEAVIPGLSRLQHYADWLEQHPRASFAPRSDSMRNEGTVHQVGIVPMPTRREFLR